MKKNITAAFIFLLTVLISANWLIHTPQGIYEKAFAVGSSVCHQISSHSIVLDGIQFPICTRCAGLYLGSFTGLIYFFWQGRKKAVPRKNFLLVLFILFLAWAGDGLNSFLTDLLNKPLLYETTNTTRLATGFGMGLVMSTALMTLFNITIWKDAVNKPLLYAPWQFAAYAVTTVITGWILLTVNASVFQFIAYISIITVILVVTILYTIFWVIVLRKENEFTSLKSLGIYITAGFGTAMLQITLLNLLRQWVLR